MAENRPTKTPLPASQVQGQVELLGGGRSELDKTPLPKEKPAPNISFNASKGGSKAELKVKQKEQPAATPPKDTKKVETSESTNVSEKDTSKVDHSPAKLVLDMIDIHEKVPAPLDAIYSGVKTNEDAKNRMAYFARYPDDNPYTEYIPSILNYHEYVDSNERQPGSKYLKRAARQGQKGVVAGLSGNPTYGLSDQVIEGLKERFNIASASVKEWTGVDLGQVDAIKDTGTLHGLVLHGGLPIAAGIGGGMLAATVGAPAIVAGLGIGSLVAVADAFLFVGAESDTLEERNSILSVIFPDLETIDPKTIENASPFEKAIRILAADAQDFITLFGAGRGLAAGAKGTKKTWKRFFKDSISPEAHMRIIEESAEDSLRAFTKGDPTTRQLIRNEKLISQLKKLDDHAQDIEALAKNKQDQEVIDRLSDSLGLEEVPPITRKEGVLGRASTKAEVVKKDLGRVVGRRIDDLTVESDSVSKVAAARKAMLEQIKDPEFKSGTQKNILTGKRRAAKVSELGATGAEEMYANPKPWTGADMGALFSQKAKISRGLIDAVEKGKATDILVEQYKQLDEVNNIRIGMTASRAGGNLVHKRLFDQVTEAMTALEQSIVRNTARLKNTTPGSLKAKRINKRLQKDKGQYEKTVTQMQNVEKIKPEAKHLAYQLANLGLRSYVQYALSHDAIVTAALSNGVNLSIDAVQLLARDPRTAKNLVGDVIEGTMDGLRRTVSPESWKALWDEMRFGIPMSRQARYDLDPISKESSKLMQAATALSSTSTTVLSLMDTAMQRVGNGINTRNALFDVLQKLPQKFKEDPKKLSEYLNRMNAGDIPPEVVTAFMKRRRQLIYSQQYRAANPEADHWLSNPLWKFHDVIDKAREAKLVTAQGKEAKDLIGYGLLATGGLFSRVSANAVEAGLRHTHLGSLTSLKYWEEIFPQLFLKQGNINTNKLVDDFLIRKTIGTLTGISLAASMLTEIDEKDQGKLPTGYSRDDIGARRMGYQDYVYIGNQKVKLDQLGRFGDGLRMMSRAKEAIARAQLSGDEGGLQEVGEEATRSLVWFTSQTVSESAMFNGLVPLLTAISKDKFIDYTDQKLHPARFVPGFDVVKKTVEAVSGQKRIWNDFESLTDVFNPPVSYNHWGEPANELGLTEKGLISDAANFTQLDHALAFFAPPKSPYNKTDVELHQFLLRTGGYNSSSKWWYRDKSGDMIFTRQSAAFSSLRRTMKSIGRTFPVGAGINYPVTYREQNTLRSLVTWNPTIVKQVWTEWKSNVEEARKKYPKNPLFKSMETKLGRTPERNLKLVRRTLKPFFGKVTGTLKVKEELHKMAYADLGTIPAGKRIKAIKKAIYKISKKSADYQMLDRMSDQGRDEFFENLARRAVMVEAWDAVRAGVHLYPPPSVVESVIDDSTVSK